MSESGEEKVRLDKWLWAARFFKTRPLATEAIGGGLVHVNGARTKPSRPVQIGDVLTIRKGPYEFVVKVLGITGRRGPASEAQKLYEETAESIAARQALSQQRSLMADSGPSPERRPDKKSRRHIIRFKGR